MGQIHKLTESLAKQALYNLSSIYSSHMLNEQNWFPQLFSDLKCVLWEENVCIWANTSTTTTTTAATTTTTTTATTTATTAATTTTSNTAVITTSNNNGGYDNDDDNDNK